MIDKETPAKAGIHTLSGYSAHADQNTLINWVDSMPKPPKEIRLVHGEQKARNALAKKLKSHHKYTFDESKPDGTPLKMPGRIKHQPPEVGS